LRRVGGRRYFATLAGYPEHEDVRAFPRGGGGLKGGYFVEPTVFADVTPEMRISREEIFGPVLCILKYDDVDEAVALANNTEFGLGGLVFGQDPETALAVADRMDTGSVGIKLLRVQPRRSVRRPP